MAGKKKAAKWPLAYKSVGCNLDTNLLKVIATDAGSQRDFRAFAQLAGHELLREEAAEGVYRYWLRKR